MRNRVIFALLVVMLLLSCITPALADTAVIDKAVPDWRNLTVQVSVQDGVSATFVGSVDGSGQVELPAVEYTGDEVGHIIVIDLGFTWTSYITAETIVSVVDVYLDSIPANHQVMFYVAGYIGVNHSHYMSVDSARRYTRGLIMPAKTQLGKPSSTKINTALVMAFSEAATPRSGGPKFFSVFALVDPGNADAGVSATALRERYATSGNSFPVTVAALYSEDFVEKNANSDAARMIRSNLELYGGFAQDNGGELICLSRSSNVVSGTDVLAQTEESRTYYTVDLKPLQSLINYGKRTHSFHITPVVGDVQGRKYIFVGITTALLPAMPTTPTPAPTPTPEPTPEPTPAPTPTPEPTPVPYLVNLGDANENSIMAIHYLYRLGYLEDKPDSYDARAASAFLDFCDANGLPLEVSISQDAYALLSSDRAIPKSGAAPAITPPPPEVTVIPPVYDGAGSTKTIRTIRLLESMGYLNEGEKSSWDDECMQAFQQMCTVSGIPFPADAEVIDDNWYDLIVVRREYPLVPAPAVTPPPVPYGGVLLPEEIG